MVRKENEIKVSSPPTTQGLHISSINTKQVIDATNNRAQYYADLAKKYRDEAKQHRDNASGNTPFSISFFRDSTLPLSKKCTILPQSSSSRTQINAKTFLSFNTK